MTCRECELLLGNFEDAGGHLAGCAACRALAEDLRLNSAALREMEMRPAPRWEWALAAAAMILMAIAAWRIQPIPTEPGPAPHMAKVEAPKPAPVVRRHAPQTKKQKFEPLKVKMLTSDPDVVIYWIVDRKEGTE
jgi:hypothetical protein